MGEMKTIREQLEDCKNREERQKVLDDNRADL